MDLITLAEQLGLDFEIRVRDHSRNATMAPEAHGDDRPASPVEVFGCTLAACMTKMVHDYCKHHGHVDEDVAITLDLRLAQHPKRVAAVTVDVGIPCRLPEGEPGEVDESGKSN